MTGAGIFLDRIVISETVSEHRQYVFNVHKWLDTGQVDGKIERMVNCAGSVPLFSDEQERPTASEETVLFFCYCKASLTENMYQMAITHTVTSSNTIVSVYSKSNHEAEGTVSQEIDMTKALAPGEYNEATVCFCECSNET